MSDRQSSSTIGELTSREQVAFDDRRREQRFACNIDLRVAPYDGVELPERIDYLAMESNDVSKSGISYFAPKAPETEFIVLMIGDYKNAHYVIAKVARCQEGFWNRRRQFAVGCRFVGQLIYG